jgi:hypothetical protein
MAEFQALSRYPRMGALSSFSGSTAGRGLPLRASIG